MANRSKVTTRWLKQARKQRGPDGQKLFKVIERRSGHVTLLNSTTETQYTLGPKLSGSRSFENTAADLLAFGVDPAILGKNRPRKPHADNPPSRPAHPPARHQQTPKEPPMVNVDKCDASKLVAGILADPDSPGLMHAAIMEEVDKSDRRPRTHKGVLGYEWRGDVFPVLRGVWKDLPLQRNHPDVTELLIGLITEMTTSGRLELLRPDHPARSLWWVRNEDDAEPDTQPTPEPADTAEPAATSSQPEPTSVSADDPTEESRDAMRLEACTTDGCAFVDTPHAVQTHNAKLRGLRHPAGSYPCPHCPRVRTTMDGYKQHLRTEHRDIYLGRHMCSGCMKWFGDRASLRAHHAADHPGESMASKSGRPSKSGKPGKPGKPGRPRKVAAVPAVPQPEPARAVAAVRAAPAAPAWQPEASPNGAHPVSADDLSDVVNARPSAQASVHADDLDGEGFADQLMTLLAEYRLLKRSQRLKDEKIEELQARIKELEGKLKAFQTLAESLRG